MKKTESELLAERAIHKNDHSWGLFRNSIMGLADLKYREKQFDVALRLYIQVCFIDLNGPRNIGGFEDDKRIKGFVKKEAFQAPAILNRVGLSATKLGLELDQVKLVFMECASEIQKELNLDYNLEIAWKKISRGAFS